MTDTQLVADALAGDNEAFAQLVARYQPSLVRQLRRQLHGDWDAANEVAQRVWLRVHLHLDKFNAYVRPFGVWLYRIVGRQFLNYLRSLRLGGKHILYVPRLDNLAAPRVRRPNELLAKALSELPEELRDAVRATYLEDRSYPEAAIILEVSVGTVHRRTTAAISRLQEKLHARNAAPKRRTQVRRRQPAAMVA